jgi:hypothetical protein
MGTFIVSFSGLDSDRKERKTAVDTMRGRKTRPWGMEVCWIPYQCFSFKINVFRKVGSVSLFSLYFMCVRKLETLKFFWKLKLLLCKVFTVSLDFLKAKHINIQISNASGHILIIQKGIELKRNWARRDRKQELTCLWQILSKPEQGF